MNDFKRYFLEYSPKQGVFHQSLSINIPLNTYCFLGYYSDSFICVFAKKIEGKYLNKGIKPTIEQVYKELELFLKSKEGELYN